VPTGGDDRVGDPLGVNGRQQPAELHSCDEVGPHR
jgi:hypothetical protein